MSGIKELEKLNSRQLETLKRRQAREISHMEEAHQNYKAEMKKTHQDEVVDLQHQNLRQVDEAAAKKEKVLTQMKNHLEDTRRMTDKELRDLKEHSEKVRAEEHNKLSVERDRIQSEHELYLDDLNYRYSTQMKKVNGEGQDQIEELTQMRSEEYANKEAYLQKRLNDQNQEFTTQFQGDAHKYKKIKDDQDRQFKKQRLDTNQRQQVEIAKLTDSHVNAVEVRDNEFRKGLKEQDLMFEQKYAHSMKVQNEDFKRLSDRHEKVISKMKSELHEQLKTAVTRSDDPFYQFTELRPTLTQYPDRVEIKVPVPEHSKKDIQLTINNKEAIVNFNRRYDDARKDNGVVNKLHKVESFTSRLMTEHILNPKSVKSSYADGVMTYVISKA